MTELAKRIQELARRYGLSAVYVFGSRAGEVRARIAGEDRHAEESTADVDIGVRGIDRRAVGIDEKVQLTGEFEELFGCSRVDLVVLDEADPFLACEIIQGERVYADDEVAADEYDLFVLRRAGDLSFFERERQKLVLNAEESR